MFGGVVVVVVVLVLFGWVFVLFLGGVFLLLVGWVFLFVWVFFHLYLDNRVFSIPPLINGNSSVREKMPEGKGLLSAKDFALQVADKRLHFLVIPANEISFSSRISDGKRSSLLACQVALWRQEPTMEH